MLSTCGKTKLALENIYQSYWIWYNQVRILKKVVSIEFTFSIRSEVPCNLTYRMLFWEDIGTLYRKDAVYDPQLYAMLSDYLIWTKFSSRL